MAIYSNSNYSGGNNSFSSFNSFNSGFGSFNSFSGGSDELTPEELLTIAKAKGGSIGQVADELVHPERSILSTIGNGFKKAFKGFVDTISIPSEIVAGMISPDYTIKEAIEQNKRVSDAIFGDKNIFNGDEPTTLQKIGNFIVRTPIDILTDPLTYLTFGASAGVLGLKSLPKVTLGIKALEKIGYADEAAKAGGVISKSLTQEGADLLKFAKNIEKQKLGTMSAENLANLTKTAEDLKTGLLSKGVTQETIDFTESELKDLLKATVEAPLQPDFAKMTVSKLLEHNPALAETMIDKGGIKFFGKSILSGQRISAVSSLIPGMNLVDNITKPIRNSVNALFDPAVVKVGADFVRLPEEYVGFRQQLKDIGESMHVDAFRNMSNVQKQLNLNQEEWRIVMDAMSIRKIPADSRLAKAYTSMLDLDEKNLDMLRKAGIPIHNLENHTGLVFVPQDTSRFIKNSQFSKDIGAAQEAAHAKFIEQKGLDITDKVPDLVKYADANPDSEIGKALGKSSGLIDTITLEAKKYKSAEEFVKGQGTPVYRGEGGSNIAQGKALLAEGKHFASDSKYPQGFGTVSENVIKPNVKVLDLGDSTFAEISQKLGIPERRYISPKELSSIAKEKGYDVLKYNGEYKSTGKQFTHFVDLTGNSTITKSQLEEIWNKAQETVSNGVQSPQQIGFAIGREKDKLVKSLQASGKSLEDALKSAEITRLDELRTAIDKLTPNQELVGKAEKLGLTKDEAGFFVNESGKIFKRVAASATELEKAGFSGFDTNLLTAYTSRTLQNQRQALGQHFMEGLIRNFSKKVDEAPKEWIPIDNAGLFEKGINIGIPLVSKDGAEYVFHPAIAKAYDEMLKGITKDEVTQGFWNAFDKLQRYWKASVTSIFPMFHGRNAISNVFLNFIDMGYETFNPATHLMAGDFIYKDRLANSLASKMVGIGDDSVKATKEFTELMQKNVFTDKTGYTWTYGEIRKAIKDNNVAFNKMLPGAGDVDMTDTQSLAKFFGLDQSKTKRNLQKLNPFNADQNAIIVGGREVGRTIEEQARLINFITNLKKTGDVQHAAQRAKQFLFDYGSLTSFEKNVLRRLIPFYSFTKFNLQLQAKTLMSSPGRISAELKAINNVGEIFGGEQLTDKEKSLLPSWMANSIALKRKTEGGGTEIISGFGTPVEQPFQAFQPNALMGSISPLIRYPVEAMTGYQFFRGKPTSEVIDAKNFKDAPQGLKDFIGFTAFQGTTKDGKKYISYHSLKPGNMNLINNLPWAGRIIPIMGNLGDKSISEQAKILNTITGVQARSADFKQLEAQQEELLRTQLEKILKDSGVRGQFIRSYNRKNTQTIE